MNRLYNIFLGAIIAFALTIFLSAMSAFGAEPFRWKVDSPDVKAVDLTDPVVREVLDVTAKRFAQYRGLSGAGYPVTFEYFITSGLIAEMAVELCKCVGMTYFGTQQVVVHNVDNSVWLHLLSHEAVHVLQYSYGIRVDGEVMEALPDELDERYLFQVREREAEMVSRWTIDYLLRNSEQFRKAVGVK